MGLFRPAWKSDNILKACRAVKKCRDEKKLYRIAREAPCPEARLEAARRLEDQETFFALAMAGSGLTNQQADALLTDEKLLIRVAREHTSADRRAGAVSRLKAPDALEKIARTDPSAAVRRAALSRLPDGGEKAELALADPDYAVRSWMVGQLEDQEMLLRVARTDENSNIRQEAALRIRDERTRCELLLPDRTAPAKERIRALQVLSPDDATLEELIYTSFSYDFSEAAAGRLRDQDACMRVARKAGGRDTVAAAIGNITDRGRLLELLGEEKTVEPALLRMRRLDMLDEEAYGHIHPSAAKKARLERDRAAFLARTDSAAVPAYLDKDPDALKALGTPEAAEALVLLLREFGEDRAGGPSKLAYQIKWALADLWRRNGAGVREAVKEAERWPVESHYDNGGTPSCHSDEGPMTFEFE